MRGASTKAAATGRVAAGRRGKRVLPNHIISRPPFWRPRTVWATPKEARATGAAEAEERRAAGVHLGAVHRAAALREVVRERRVAVADTPEAGRSSRDPASSAVRTGRDDSPADKHKAARTTEYDPGQEEAGYGCNADSIIPPVPVADSLLPCYRGERLTMSPAPTAELPIRLRQSSRIASTQKMRERSFETHSASRRSGPSLWRSSGCSRRPPFRRSRRCCTA